MPWKVRNGRKYYYRSIREGGTVRSEYVGAGPTAQLIAEADRLDALERGRASEAWRSEKEALDAEDLDRARRSGVVEAVVRGALEAAGFRQHKRGEWRRPRMKSEQSSGDPSVRTPPAPIAEIHEVLEKAQAGDKPARRRLRELIALDPGPMIEIAGGNLATQVQHARVEKLTKSNPIFGVSVPAKLDALRAELEGPDPPPVERLLVERVLLCWLDLHQLEMVAAQGSADLTIGQADHRERVRDRTNRRYLQALKTLASVRKLGIVAVQVQIDKQQINVDLGGAEGREKAPAPENE
jgi:hypothetical protein